MRNYSLCRRAAIVRYRLRSTMFMSKTQHLAASIFVAVLSLAACHRDAPAVKMGTYRAVLQVPGGELPFGLELVSQGSATVGYLVNGKERLRLSEVAIDGAHLTIRMPGYETRLDADAAGGQLHGEIYLDKLGGRDQHIPLTATLGEEYRFFANPAANNPDVSGRWAVTLVDDHGA